MPLEFQLVNLAAGEQKKPDYLRINRSGRTPTLVDGDFRLAESNAIEGRDYLVDGNLTLADFAVAAPLEHAEAARFPLDAFGNIRRWYAGLAKLDAWRRESRIYRGRRGRRIYAGPFPRLTTRCSTRWLTKRAGRLSVPALNVKECAACWLAHLTTRGFSRSASRSNVDCSPIG